MGSRGALVDAALKDSSIKKAIADKKHAPTLFKKLNLSDVETIDNLFDTSNDTRKIEAAINQFESKYEKPRKGGTLASADINAEDKRESFDEKLTGKKCELGNEYVSMQCEVNEKRQSLDSCFRNSNFEISKDENNAYQWTVTNASSSLCGRPKYFDVSSGMNGARVYLDSLISSDAVRKDIAGSLGKGLKLKAITDTCGNDGHETADVTITERDRQYEVFIKIKCNSTSCSKYICHDNEMKEKPVSEILLAYKLPGRCTKWNVFGRARVIGTSVTVHGQCIPKRSNRRSLLSTVGGDRSSG